MTQEYKIRGVEEISSKLKTSPLLLVTNFSSLKVTDLEKLRTSLRSISSDYMVVKNAFMQRAIKKCKLESLLDYITGTVGLVFSNTDAVTCSKALVNFAKGVENFQIRGALLNGETLTQEQINTLAQLPPREVLLAKAVNVIKSPISGLVMSLKDNLNRLVRVLDGISKKGGK